MVAITQKGSDSKKDEDSYPWALLTVTSFGMAAQGLTENILNVALPAISAHFQTDSMVTSWILLSYMLFHSVLILIFGRLADIYGRRKLYLIGVAGYALTSLLCGFAPNVQCLIAFRILQAFGSSLIVTNTIPLLTDAFPRKRLGQALGVNTLVLAIAQLCGPVLGGYLVVNFSWHWVFWVNVPLAAICAIGGFFRIKAPIEERKREKIDVPGNILVLFSLGGLVVALSVGSEVGLSSLPVLLGFAVFLIGLALFLYHERRSEHPMIQLSMFKNRLFAMGNLASFLVFIVRTAVLLLVSLHVQFIILDNAQEAGFIVLPMAIGTALVAPIVGLLTRRFQAKYLSTSGLVLSCAGILMIVCYIALQFPFPWLIAGQFVLGIGNGVFQVPNTTTIMLSVPEERRGIANGVRAMAQNVGKLLGSALTMVFITAYMPEGLKSAIYLGQAQLLGGSDVLLLSNGFRLAFVVMLTLCIIAMITSWSRGKEAPRRSRKAK